MQSLSELLQSNLFMPYIRNCDYAVRKPWYYPESRLLDYLIVYFQEGHCQFVIDKEVYDFYQGDFCLVQPGSLNGMKGLTNTITPFAHMDLFYNPFREEGFSTRPGLTDLSEFSHLIQPRLNDLEHTHIPVKLRPKQPVQFRDLFLDVIAHVSTTDPIRQMKSQMLASRLVIEILEDHTAYDTSKKVKIEAPSLNWITSYFSFNLSEPLTIRRMAERAHLSPSRFNAVFKEEFGTSPYQYLLNLRIDHAKKLLRTTSLTITEIAGYCGFKDIHHFSKTFKERTGQSPIAFRRNNLSSL